MLPSQQRRSQLRLFYKGVSWPRHCQEQRGRLEAELDSFRSAPDRLRSSRQADAQHVAAREAWLAEQRKLKQELTNASAQVASLEQELEQGRERDTFDRLASVERSRQLREQVAEQRQLCRAAQQALRAAESDLAAAQAQRRTPRQTAMPDAGRVAELKARVCRCVCVCARVNAYNIL